jgi:glycosyltransferase involved in cell wall biosynthesis
MSRLRVARIITRLNVGGPAYQAVILNHLLPKRDDGYESLLIYGEISEGESSFESLLSQFSGNSVKCPHLQREISLMNDFRAFRSIEKILRDFKPDIVHTHTAKAGLLGRLAAIRTKTPVILHTYHGHVLDGYFSKMKERFILGLERYMAKRSSRLITISPKLADDLSYKFQIAPREKFSVIELGLPLERFLSLPPRGVFRKKFGIADDTIVLGSLGRLVPIKNFARMIDVFYKLKERPLKQKMVLLIGGTGPLEQDLRQQTRMLELEKDVLFAGLVEDLPAYYSDIDLAVMTSDNEGTPAFLLEAQAAGKMVVAPNVGGISDILCPQAGKLVAGNSVDEYVSAIESILSRWDDYAREAQAVRTGVVQRFSPQRLADDIDGLYRQLING